MVVRGVRHAVGGLGGEPASAAVAGSARRDRGAAGVIALAKQAPGLSDDQLRARLAGLAPMARSAVTDSRCTDEAPAGRRSSDAAPASAHGGQPVPDPPATTNQRLHQRIRYESTSMGIWT